MAEIDQQTGGTRILAVWTGHRFRKVEGAWLIPARQVDLPSRDQRIRIPGIVP